MPTVRVIDSKPVRIAGRQIGPRAFDFTDDLSPDFTLTAEIRFVGGRYVARALTVRARRDGSVSADLLRDVSVSDFVRRAVSDQAMFNAEEIYTAPDITQGPTDDNLKVLAALYRYYLAVGGDPVRETAEKMGLTRSTAGRWVMRARKKKYLGQTDEGKAGA